MRLALGVEYAGFAFCGFQSQPSRCGVQDALESAIGEIAGHPVGVVAAGRTDAGVHAASQVVHFDTEAARPPTAWVRGVNTHLPAQAAVLWAHAVDRRFPRAVRGDGAPLHVSPAQSRASGPALLAGRVGWYHHPLDVDAMRAGGRASCRHARFLVVPRGGVPGEVAGQDAFARCGGARRRARALRFFRQCLPPSHGAQHRRCADRRRRRQEAAGVDRRAPRCARPHAEARRRSRRRGCTSPAPTTMRASACRRRRAT